MLPTVGKRTISVDFVRPSVCLSVVFIANNSRTQRPVPKFGRKVTHLRCDSHASFKVKRSKVRVRGGRGHTVSAEPGGHTACFALVSIVRLMPVCLSHSLLRDSLASDFTNLYIMYRAVGPGSEISLTYPVMCTDSRRVVHTTEPNTVDKGLYLLYLSELSTCWGLDHAPRCCLHLGTDAVQQYYELKCSIHTWTLHRCKM